MAGTVVESVPPTRLATTWAGPDEERPDGPGRVTFDIERHEDIVRLTVTHENIADHERDGLAAGWSAMLSSLKSFVETGPTLSKARWEMAARRPSGSPGTGAAFPTSH